MFLSMKKVRKLLATIESLHDNVTSESFKK